MKLNKTITLFFTYLLAVNLFVGCDENPYPNIGDGTIVKTPTLIGEKPVAVTLYTDPLVSFYEGVSKDYKVLYNVEAPGEAILKAYNLPVGATFDEASGTLTWEPGYFDGNDPDDPTVTYRNYTITIGLRSTAAEIDEQRKTLVLQVNDSPRYIDIITSRDNTVYEGGIFKKKIEFDNPDFPQGPFVVNVKGMPANFNIKEISGTEWEMSYTPDYFRVNRSQGDSVKFTGSIQVTNPVGTYEESVLNLTIKDSRLDPEIIVPETLEVGLDAVIQVAAYDKNREVAPKLKLLSTLPFGQVIGEQTDQTEYFSSSMDLGWKDIPLSQVGKKFTLKFEACVLGATGGYNKCVRDSTEVTIVAPERLSPLISRTTWKIDDLIYIGFGKTYYSEVNISDRIDPKLNPKVEVFPEEMRQYISWSENSRGKGTLTIKGIKKAGVYQFYLKATSDYNVSSSESFIFEVLPEYRPKTLMFADSTRDPEVLFYKNQFKADMELMNPAIQAINVRNISDRDTLVITTSTLLDKSEAVQKRVMSAIDQIKNIVVASPLIENLPEKFYEKLTVDYELAIRGRLSTLTSTPLDQFKVYHNGEFTEPKQDIMLKGITSSESSDPLVFTTNYDREGKICLGLLGINPEREGAHYMVGVSCKRENGGKIALLGTEWADFKTSDEDSGIPELWLNKLLNRK